jgi:hypothetical protein
VRLSSDPVPENVLDVPPFSALQFTSNDVERVLQDLNVNKGSGPDGILPAASAFAKPLSLLFNRYLTRAFFPTGRRFHTLLRY